MVRWSYLFFALIASFTIIVAGVASESARFGELSTLEDPLINIQKIVTEKTVNPKMDTLFYWEKKKLLVMTEDNDAKLSADPAGIVVKNGKVFVSTKFNIKKQIFWNLEKVSEFSHKLLSQQLQNDFVRVGPLFLDILNSSVVIERKSDVTFIYTSDHHVPIWFDGATTPVILPSNSMAEIDDSLVSDTTKLISYSKVKKEWKFQPIEEDNLLLKSGELELNDVIRKSAFYAQDLPKSWMWGKPNSMIAGVVRSVKEAQSIYAFGFPPEMEKQRIFLEFIQPFLSAQSLFLEPKMEIKKELDSAEKILKATDWAKFISDSQKEKEQWETLQFYQKIWIQDAFPGSKEELFKKFWENIDNKEFSWDEKIIQNFLDFERLIYNNDVLIATKHKDQMKKLINDHKKILTKSEQQTLARIRQELIHLLSVREEIQMVDYYEFLKIISQKEIQNIANDNYIDISLEIARNILDISDSIMTDENKSVQLGILVSTYKLIDLDKIKEKLGRDLFSSDEQFSMKIFDYMDRTGMTYAEAKSTMGSATNGSDLENKVNEVSDKSFQEGKKEHSVSYNKRVIRQFLNKYQFSTNKLVIEQKNQDNNYLFNVYKLYWKDDLIGGIYNQEAKKFLHVELTKSGKKLKQISIEGLAQYLRDQAQQQRVDSVNETVKSAFIPQTTQHALLNRRLVEKTLYSESFPVKMDPQIIALDKRYTKFSIKEVPFGRNFKINLEYDSNKKSITGIIIKQGRIEFKYPDPIKLDQLVPYLNEQVKTILNKKR